ncbi:Spx/MgsR family RNA polymerase-binding regulatory protein [Lactococcus protaetiae]|uniref:Spx/MgsR family RNA polymerase-binding regulatory protein n=1 Tax=Lactococcus protaetiae TaxID=2592653 RepID=A0A514Z987_9LACT|nr:Spx/MgsR family RNA polymerase-binding regulatory protein [Lactococcus protaetiae]MCL2113416.1 Spx/MgsR family RNA polymerase-binding regulatory protein [Streptococcaceae bacterium]QDK71152.1 Spx/MgsR family RNA polymerase-binding regulatory protein [Lactococcus protaetiae]
MIKLFYFPGCSSSQKAKQWLIKNELNFEEVNLIEDELEKSDILRILSLTELGAEEILSKRSHIYKALDLDFDTLSLSELVKLISKNRGLLRRPLLVDEYRLQVGYNEDDIRQFLPRSVRKIEIACAIDNVRMWDKERATYN